ncbi:hypothetical protein [Acidocella aminolytica]|uniref:hypothetical protein n=1 Tax=Acidocella aminolytica TaxID=33998 RepID=UPI001114E482|nr:hypothetical protein [Acidocella aminolytica]GBQ35361.1 hypothetical protein AA11237_0953 [Acidocella aminolytica 101 = DSM 11237]
MKNRILLENYCLLGDIPQQIVASIEHYSNHRYHEGLGNPKSANVHHGRAWLILKQRQQIKRQTIQAIPCLSLRPRATAFGRTHRQNPSKAKNYI